jgi:hypothetical protein
MKQFIVTILILFLLMPANSSALSDLDSFTDFSETIATVPDDSRDVFTDYTPLDDAKSPKNPFQPCIEPPLPQVPPKLDYEKPPSRSMIPPLPITLSLVILGNDKKSALIELNGTAYEVEEGFSETGGLFKVKEISQKSVRIFDSRIQKERIINIVE